MEEKTILDFHRKLTYERINNNNFFENDLVKSYKDIMFDIASDYNEYRKNVSQFLAILENNNSKSISYSIHLFLEMYGKLIEVREFKILNLSIIEQDGDDETLNKMIPIFEASYLKNNHQRMSEENFDISSLSDMDKKEMASLIVDKLQNDSKLLNWDIGMVEVTMMYLTFLRQILLSLSNVELFYHAVSLFFDRLSSSEYYQTGRDIAEEVIISSYKDGIPELGYFNSFRLYSNIGSIHASLFYANLSIMCILQKQPPYSDKYIKEVILQGIKLFRNVHLELWATQIYDKIPIELKYADYERRSLDHTNFTNLLMMKNPSLPSMILDYLNKEREKIFSEGENDSMPWLITLYNIRRMYSDADFSSTGLGYYIDVFELIVPSETIIKFKDIIEGNLEGLKRHLKESIVKLNETRNTSDFVYDNDFAIKISSRLIECSAASKDVPAFLLSMMLKSDYSILFQPKESFELVTLKLPDINIDSLETLYENQSAFLEALPINPNCAMIWLGYTEGELYHLQLLNKEFRVSPLSKWSYNTFRGLTDNDFFVNLRFDETIKDKDGVRLLSPEEFKQEEDEIASKLEIAKLEIPDITDELYIVKDMEISKFPHNLFPNQNGDFIAKNIPVTNVLSTEWLLHTNGFRPLKNDYSKSIWIPTENGDYTLNYLYSNIEKSLQEHSFDVFNQIEITKQLSSDINIICSHGSKNISEIQIVSQEHNLTYNLDNVIGNGKILIFFVCYSGSMKTEFFRNNVASIVKRFILKGYDSVIAPFWALDVRIPRYWLPEFLKSINGGFTVSQATFNANKKVYEKYPIPAAWACLHLYGNPHIRIE